MSKWNVVELDLDDAAQIGAFFESASGSDPTMRPLPEAAFRAWAARAEPRLAGVTDGDGLIGFLYSTPSWCGREHRNLHHFRAFVLPSQRRRGIGSALLAWVGTLPNDGPRPGLQCSSMENWVAGTGFLEHHGFGVFLDDLSMQRPCVPVPASALPVGIALRLFVASEDAEQVVSVHREAYANDPMFNDMTVEQIGLQSQRAGFALLVAETTAAGVPRRIVGYCLSLGVKDSDGPHVESVAVRPDARRRGVGRALLRQALTARDPERCPPITLDVHADNPARGLYESEGFVVVSREFTYRRDLEG